jgi:hypothetical protein
MLPFLHPCRLSCHTSLLVATFAASLLLRCMLLLVPPHFLAVAALVLLSDCIGAPVGAIVDAAVVGACKSDGDYGESRSTCSTIYQQCHKCWWLLHGHHPCHILAHACNMMMDTRIRDKLCYPSCHFQLHATTCTPLSAVAPRSLQLAAQPA